MSLLQRYFPLIAICASIAAYIWPSWLVQQKSWIMYLLGAVMFCMGASLTVNHFKQAMQRYPLILLALTLQFGLMPLIAWQLSTWAGLSVALTAGMILVGSVPGGTASNVICYISKGDVALSITITAVSTLIAIVATPLLAYAYLSAINNYHCRQHINCYRSHTFTCLRISQSNYRNTICKHGVEYFLYCAYPGFPRYCA